jgi:hypothetical protein
MGVDLSSMLRPEDRENAALLHEAKQFKLENIQDLKNGKFRIRVSSGVPLQSDQIELPMETSGPAASLQTHESAPSAHLP